jgi:heme-degrading monooxygenase HmoA
MYARLTRIQVRLERFDHSINIFKESILPATRQQLGFRGIYLFTNPKTGEGITLSLWDSEQDAIESEKNHYYQEQLVKVMSFLTAPPVREGYEVEYYELKDPTTFVENK